MKEATMSAVTMVTYPDEPREPRPRKSSRGLICGLIAGPLFVVVLFLEGVTRAHYSSLRHPGSSLALGDFGWLQDVNFIVAGLLTLAFAIGLRRSLRPGPGATWGPLLISWWAIGLIGAGIFVTDPVSGYPPGTPNLVDHPTVHGSLHDLLSVPAFAALFVAFLVFARRFGKRHQYRWMVYSVVTAVVFAVAFGLSGVGFRQVSGLVDDAGLSQRVAVVAGWAWLTLLAVHLLRRRRIGDTDG
jgi:hypothetical membrane protein